MSRTENETAAANAHISLQIMLLRAAGATVQEAMDAVLGAGTYARIASELYDGLRAKSGG